MSQTPHPRRIFRQKKDHLPHDIVLIILARLPVKSVLRFRCVSKTWYSSIATPNFISNHLIYHKNNNNNNLAYLISIPPTIASPLNINIPIFIGGYDHAFNRISEYPIPSGFFPTLYSYPADSCHGLVCFTNHNNLPANTGAIYLWNPSIRKLKCLPAFSQTQYLRFCTGFAYQSNTNDYKVVKISQMPADHNGIKTEAEVYTLSSNSWRRVEISLANTILGVPVDNRRTATFVSGALHWLGNVSEGASFFMILSFDVNNDKFGEIALPHVQQQQLQPQGVMAKINRLMVFNGKLAFITLGYLRFDDANQDEYNDFMNSNTPHSCFIWVMGDYGVHESWSKLFFVQFENVISVRFFGCASRGELLVIKKHNHESNNERRSFTVVSLDLETSREKDLGFQKVPDIATTFMESLVLLDGATELSG